MDKRPSGRPKTSDVRFSVRTDENTYQHLQSLARLCGKPTSWVAESLIRAWFVLPRLPHPIEDYRNEEEKR